MSARRVVTLPPGVHGEAARAFALRAQRAGADLLELRTDLHVGDALEVAQLASVLPLLVAERGRPLPSRWCAAATLVDREEQACADSTLLSHHATDPLEPEAAAARWPEIPAHVLIKHVEPAGPPHMFSRLLRTQRLLAERFGRARVTVLATGAHALPLRAVLALHNALDYVSLDGGWQAAPGQCLLADAVRAALFPSATQRRGILGHGIEGSRSPRIHAAPFDRIDLPADAPIEALLQALHPHYCAFAVTSPFKHAAARACGATLPAVNTLVRTTQGYEGHNTDVAGARALLDRMRGVVTVLGDGGVTAALRLAAAERAQALTVLRHATIDETIRGDAVWTWPARVKPPAQLRFEGARVAIVAYGKSALAIEEHIRARGGVPWRAGARWFIAQARAQRELWMPIVSDKG